MIANAICHAIDPPLLFFLHQQVEELEVILAKIQAYLADVVQDKVLEVDQKVHEALDEKEHQDHQRRQILVVMELVKSHPSFSSVTSGG